MWDAPRLSVALDLYFSVFLIYVNDLSLSPKYGDVSIYADDNSVPIRQTPSQMLSMSSVKM